MTCHAMAITKPYMFLETLKKAYYSTFNSVMYYDLPFWGISTHSNIIFGMQKRIVRPNFAGL
jgi:hypothetical protein